MYKLIKLSKPGWTKNYETVEELTKEVRQHTCSLCKDSFGTDLESMLVSDCGVEYEVDGIRLDGAMSFEEHLQDIADRAA